MAGELHQIGNDMVKFFGLALAATIGLTTAAMAASVPATSSADSQSIVRVAEGCGAGWYRYGPDKQCHKFDTSYGSNRGTTIACPPGMHIGPEGVYCWPNH